MILGDPRLRCSFAKGAALASIIFYAVLVPWHTVSQATALLLQLDSSSPQRIAITR